MEISLIHANITYKRLCSFQSIFPCLLFLKNAIPKNNPFVKGTYLRVVNSAPLQLHELWQVEIVLVCMAIFSYIHRFHIHFKTNDPY